MLNSWAGTLSNGSNMILQIIVVLHLLLHSLYALPENNNTLLAHKKTEGSNPRAKSKPIFYYLDNAKPTKTPELQEAASVPVPGNYLPSAQKPLALSTLTIGGLSAQIPPLNTQVADQQVLYEFKQTPPNALSNYRLPYNIQPNIEVTTPSSFYPKQVAGIIPVRAVHPGANKQFRPSQPLRAYPQAIGLNGPVRHPSASSTIVNPVHHNLYTNHIPYGQPQPLDTINPAGFVNVEAPLVYSPQVIPEEKITPHSIYHKRVYHNQQKQMLPLIPPAEIQNPQNSIQTHSGTGALHRAITTLGKISNNHYLPPITQNGGFIAPADMQKVDEPSAPAQQDDEEEEKAEDGEDEEVENEEGEESEDDGAEEDEADEEAQEEEAAEPESNNEEEEKKTKKEDEIQPFNINDYKIDFENTFFKPSQYKFKKDDEKENEEAEAEEDCDKEEEEEAEEKQEDGERDDSKQITSYYKYPAYPVDDYRYPPYEFYEGFSSNSKYNFAKPGGLPKKFKPLGKFKKVKYSKVKGLKPRVEKIQGSYSEEVPITHKQKVFTQRWFMTKNVE